MNEIKACCLFNSSVFMLSICQINDHCQNDAGGIETVEELEEVTI